MTIHNNTQTLLKIMPIVNFPIFGAIDTDSKIKDIRLVSSYIDESSIIDINETDIEEINKLPIKSIYQHMDLDGTVEMIRENNLYDPETLDPYVSSIIMREVGIYETEFLGKVNVNQTHWFRFMKTLVQLKNKRHVVLIFIKSLHESTIFSDYMRNYIVDSSKWNGENDTMVWFEVSYTISCIENVQKKYVSDKPLDVLYALYTNEFNKLFSRTLKETKFDMMRRIPKMQPRSFTYKTGYRMRKPIIIDGNDSYMSSKGGVGGYSSNISNDPQSICSTCGFTDFDCPQHIVYMKLDPKNPYYMFSYMEARLGHTHSSYDSVLSWIVEKYIKSAREIKSFLYDETSPTNMERSMLVYMNRLSYSSNGAKYYNTKRKAGAKIGDIVYTKQDLYNLGMEVLTNQKIRSWAIKYGFIDRLKMCDMKLMPMIPPRFYKNKTPDRKSMMAMVKDLHRNPSNTKKIINILLKDTTHEKSILKNIREKKGLLDKTVTSRAANTARQILAGNIFVHPTEVVLSRYLGDTMSMVVRVTRNNIDILRNARIKFVKRNDVLLKQSKAGMIRIGDIIHRKLEDGDVIVINRQPSLDQGSSAAFKIRITEDTSYTQATINTATVPPFGGDYDGDEVNGSVPATLINSRLVYSQLSHESRQDYGYQNYAMFGPHMDIYQFLYTISTNDIFEFPIPFFSAVTNNKPRVIITEDTDRYYTNPVNSINKSKSVNIVDRYIVDYKDINTSQTDLHDSFAMLNVKKHPYIDGLGKLKHDDKVDALMYVTGFVRMSGYDMLDILMQCYDGFTYGDTIVNGKVNRNHKFTKGDFKYNSDNISSQLIKYVNSINNNSIYIDWVWMISNIAGIFLTHNHEYSSLSIDDIYMSKGQMGMITNSLNNLESDIYHGDTDFDIDPRMILRQYARPTAPDISNDDMKKRIHVFKAIGERFDTLPFNKDNFVAPGRKHNMLYQEAYGGSKGGPGKFSSIYVSNGGLRQPETVFPNSLSDHVIMMDDYKDLSRYGFIKSAVSSGLNPRELYHSLSMLHFALQQTPLTTKTTGTLEKSITPMYITLKINKDGDIVNKTSMMCNLKDL